MQVELKPCPFCGGEAAYHTDSGPTGEVYGWVGCNQCDAMSCHIDVRSMQPEETHPIDAWNTRHQARAEVVGEIVAWLGTKDNYDFDDLAIDIEAKFGKIQCG